MERCTIKRKAGKMNKNFILISPYSKKLYVEEWICEEHKNQVHRRPVPCPSCGKKLTFSPREMLNAKQYPFWNEVITLLRITGETIIQIGLSGEAKLEGVDDFFTNLPFREIDKLLLECKMFMSVDNCLPHLAHYLGVKKGIVIWGPSDPDIFGYPEFCNLLKDRKYLRKDMFDKWEKCQFNKDAFVDPSVVANAVVQLNREL
jgi:ADP-heptose:LPS heptosyltransferase